MPPPLLRNLKMRSDENSIYAAMANNNPFKLGYRHFSYIAE